MNDEILRRELRRIAIEADHRCFGCGFEHNCGIHGCAIIREALERLELWEDMPMERAQELAQAEKDRRLVVLESSAKEGDQKPPCFYNDMGQAFCLGFSRGECDDEPIDRCKGCWYCESSRDAAEAALKKRETENEHEHR